MSTQPIYNSALSFGAMKKSQFDGVDFAVVEKFKAPIEKFHSKDDFDDWAQKRQESIFNSSLGGKSKETVRQRELMKYNWHENLSASSYTPAEKLLILNGVTKNLNKKDETFIPAYNEKVLDKTMTRLKEELSINPKLQFDFGKRYKTGLNEYYMNNSIPKKTGWIVIPSINNDTENFQENVKKVQSLSSERWCTKGIHAPLYLSQGDFHIYMEDGVAKIGLKFVDNTIDEIEDSHNKCIMQPKYFDILKHHIEKNGYSLTESTKNIYDISLKKFEIVEQAKKDLGKALEDCNAEKIFNYFGIDTQRDKNGNLTISHYAQPEICSFNDYGINEKELLKQVCVIRGDADFTKSSATSLENVEAIGGNVILRMSQVKDLGELKSIGGNVDFAYSSVLNLGKVEIINGDVNFGYSSISELNNLKRINGNANFYYSNVTNMGKLQKIGKNANFSFTIMESLGQLETIGGSAIFNSTKLKDLGGLKYINGDASFKNCKISNLVPLTKIGGNLDIIESDIYSLGILNKVIGNFSIFDSKVTHIGQLEHIYGNIYTDNSSVSNFNRRILFSIKDYSDKKNNYSYFKKMLKLFHK